MLRLSKPKPFQVGCPLVFYVGNPRRPLHKKVGPLALLMWGHHVDQSY